MKKKTYREQLSVIQFELEPLISRIEYRYKNFDNTVGLTAETEKEQLKQLLDSLKKIYRSIDLTEEKQDIHLTEEEKNWLMNMLSRYHNEQVVIEKRVDGLEQYYLKVVINKNVSCFPIDKEEFKSLQLFTQYDLKDL